MVLWFLTAAGRRLRVTDAFTYRLYAQGSEPALLQLAAEAAPRGWIEKSYLDDKIDFNTGRTQVVLCLELKAYHYLPRLLAYLGTLEGFSFGNCDLDPASYYLYLNKIFPCSWYDLSIQGDVLQSLTPLEDPFQDELTLPPLNTLELSLSRDYLIPLGAGNSLTFTWEGRTLEIEAADPPALVMEVSRCLANLDPDLIISDWGDERILPRLWQWSQRHRLKLPLDREPRPVSRQVNTRGRSYFSYGRIVYQGPSVPFYGRWHVDRRNSFFYREAGLAGLAQLARIGQMPLQKLARTSPGTLITSMQLARAVADNILIPWRKGEPERFKSALELLITDKGGLVFQPPVGFHTQVAEIDFASMYPTIMAIHNISPETIDCGCCSGPRVPEAGYVLCQRREGLVPRTLRPILTLRARLKIRAQQAADPEVAAEFTARQSALKWILVTCFGYLGYKNARFGRIEAHEAVTAYGRDKLLTAKEVCETAGFQVLHGLTDCLWIKKREDNFLGRGQGAQLPGPPPQILSTIISDFASELQLLCDRITAATGVTMALEGVYRWLVFLPSHNQADRPVPNRYFGVFEDGKLKYRGLMCRRRDTPPLVRQAQQELLGRLARAANWQEAAAMGPELQDLLAEYTSRLEQGRVEPRDLVITRVLSRPVEQYQVETHTALAAKQLAAAGVALVPGEKVRYVVRERQGPPEIRVLAAPFLDTLDRYDTAYYVELLDRAVKEVLGPFAGGQDPW
jgi:DNA polymerase-2